MGEVKKNIKLERFYQKGYEDGKKFLNSKMRKLGQADVLDILPNVKGIGPKIYRRVVEDFRNQKEFEAIKFSISIRKNEYQKYFHPGTEIIWNQKKHVITRIDRINFKEYEIQINGMCVLSS